MFLGEYEHSVDAKGRLAVPAKFRAQLEGGLVVTRGIERCLQVYPMAQWQQLSEKVSGLSLGQVEARALRRTLFAQAFDTEVDRQGRILVPASLREFARIGELAVITGMDTFFEIWAKDAWEATLAELTDSNFDWRAALADMV